MKHFSVNNLGGSVLKFWPNIFLIKVFYQAQGQVCKYVLSFIGLAPGLDQPCSISLFDLPQCGSYKTQNKTAAALSAENKLKRFGVLNRIVNDSDSKPSKFDHRLIRI